MLRIRQEQMSAYERVLFDNFLERGVAHLRTHLAAETKPFTDDQLRLRIRQCVERTKRYGLTTEQHVITFADATYLAGEHFDGDPKYASARQLLTDPTRSPDAKAAFLLLGLPPKSRDK